MLSRNDVSPVRRPGMDRRPSPSYEAGFDACDPLGSVLEWSESNGARAARVLRRRCRSEGVERSPYDDVLRAPEPCARAHHRPPPNKSHFTLNAPRHAPSQPPNTGDYLMTHQHNMLHSYQSGKSRLNRSSPQRNTISPQRVSSPLTNSKVDDRLPKVEELLEKVDQEMLEVAMMKQPLKSILNNPLPKTPPQGILKKPKSKVYQESKLTIEGRRRQRASSESDNMCTFHLGSPVPAYDSRLTYLSSNTTKRAKDNSGSGYSYGSAIATLTTNPLSKNGYKPSRCSCKDAIILKGDNDMHVLRTTAINNEVEKEEPPEELPIPEPIPSRVASPTKKNKTVKKKKIKTKTTKQKSPSKLSCNGADVEDQESLSRSPSPDAVVTWQMETDALIAEIDKLEHSRPHSPAPPPASQTPVKKEEVTEKSSVNKLPPKLSNGTVSTAKSIPPILEKEDSSLVIPACASQCLRPSLFPRVPPYLKFSAHDDTTPVKIPPAIQKHLKWKLTTITPIVVKKTLTNSGFRLIKSDSDSCEMCPQEETIEWIGIWGKHMKSLMFRSIKDGQKMNHFPGTFQIGRKDRLWRNLQKLVNKFGMKEFGIMPKTYVLPHDLKLLKHDWEKHVANNEKWIIKPPASARGTGIKVVSRWSQIPKKRPVVVQRYISKPYLINGSKFDMRLYVLVTSVHPLRIYLYKDGLARFASVKYNDEISSLNDRYMHLTNYSINRLSKNYTPNEDFAACEGHKWTLQSLFQYLKTEKNVDTAALWESMKDLVIKTIISGEASISSLTKANVTSRYNCYELFGIDVLLDEDLKPWLLEVNISPSLHSASPLDLHVKGPLVRAVLNVAQYHVPARAALDALDSARPHRLGGLPYDCRIYTVYLSKEERDKHIIYTNMEDRDMYLRDILSTLTPDDVRHLLQAEDELTQTGALERVFPSPLSHRYLRYLAGPRYYNRLFDAWETRYGQQRRQGVELLRNLCDIGYHLEVPPVPLKNDVDAPSPPPSEAPSAASLGDSGEAPDAPLTAAPHLTAAAAP